jgi:hypothetical protein
MIFAMPNDVHGIINILKSGLAGSKPATTRACSLFGIVRALYRLSALNGFVRLAVDLKPQCYV